MKRFFPTSKKKILVACAVDRETLFNITAQHPDTYEIILSEEASAESIAELLQMHEPDALMIDAKAVPRHAWEVWRKSKPNQKLLCLRPGKQLGETFFYAADYNIAVANSPSKLGVTHVTDYITRKLAENKIKTLGLVGYGAIGQEIEKWALENNIRVKVYTHQTLQACSRTPHVTYVKTLEELCADVDAISVQCHYIKNQAAQHLNNLAAVKHIKGHNHIYSTEKMFNEIAFKRLKSDTLFICVSPAGVIDENAFANACKQQKIGRFCFNGLEKELTVFEQQLRQGLGFEALEQYKKQGSSFDSAAKLIQSELGTAAKKDLLQQAFKQINDYFNSKPIKLYLPTPLLSGNLKTEVTPSKTITEDDNSALSSDRLIAKL